MINHDSITAVRAARRPIPGTITNTNPQSYPLYQQYSFAQIPHLVRHALTGQTGPAALPNGVLKGLPDRYDKVIVLLIDALGWCFIEPRLDRYPFLRRFRDQGVVSMLTSQFPSTTSAHMTTLGTGLTPGESGVFEWFYYEPMVDRIITPLLFSLAGDDGRDTLRQLNVDPNQIYPPPLVRQQMIADNVKLYNLIHGDYANSVYSTHMKGDGKSIPFKGHSEGLVNLAQAVINEPGRAYFFHYVDTIDSLLHQYGPGAPQVEAELDSLLYALETHLHGTLDGNAHNTLLLLTADHGQIGVAPQKTIYLNQRDPGLVDLLRNTRDGQPIYYGGSGRDMFLYIKPERIEEAITRLIAVLDGAADVCRVSDLIAHGYFGPTTPSETFLSRVGNLVVLPAQGQLVWWYVNEKSEQRFRGHHGGLSPEEMEIGLLALAYR